MLDKRAEPRYEVDWPVRLSHRRYGSVSGRTLNVGLSGVLFLTQDRFQIGDQIEMRLWIKSTLCIDCVCRVARLQAVLTNEYAIGAFFVRISEEGRMLLSGRLQEVQHREQLTQNAGRLLTA